MRSSKQYVHFKLKGLVIYIFLITTVFSQQLNAQKLEGQNLPKVAVLGMFHFVSKNNTVSQNFTEVYSERRQREIEELVASLRQYQATKIAVERPYRTEDELNQAYQAYLQGAYDLSAEETDQVAFRLAKALGHKQLYLVYHPVDFDFERLQKYARQEGQDSVIRKVISNAEELANTYDSIAEEKGIQEAVYFLNLPESINKNHYGYQLLSELGDEHHQPGKEETDNWYQSNVAIFNNIRKLASLTNDRVLVIYGQGHAKILNQLVEKSPELELTSLTDYLKQ
ncbi:DUF5694 domain-containing protein [Porifericola rhodea]|uniref:DUF5694 domain-containing protein n=1 Tax=Porifericola rhodea TaxID=930972 RepID=UPI002665891C|nr:DUF5694 domain-containing protein [Porifericola rhodea]WKN30346.1 DUF5694 domain-containing protein [Porifericola rhodea]